MRTFTFSDGSSNKFWNIELQGKKFTVQFGRIGTAGQTQTKAFGSADEAKKAYEKLIKEKLGKGYAETTVGGATAEAKPTPQAIPVSATQLLLEKALIANPNDLATHAAYADHLMELGNPLGELIQVQLALEDESRSAADRKTLKTQEAKLLKTLRPKIIGQLHEAFTGSWSGPDKPFHVEIERGWLKMVRTLPFPGGIVALLAASPEIRLLQRLEVIYDMEYHPWDFDSVMKGPKAALNKIDNEGDEEEEDDDMYSSDTYDAADILPPLVGCKHLEALRAFKLGFSDPENDFAHSTMVGVFNNITAKALLKFLQRCPNLEELYFNTSVNDVKSLFSYDGFHKLRVLQYYYGENSYGRREKTYPLALLAKNPSLGNITTLKFHPGREAELNLEDVQALLKATNMPKLTHLQLHMTTYGDDLIEPLIKSKIMQRLEVLDIGYGNLTDEGARELAAAPDLKHLKVLNIHRNALTVKGIAYLKATGVPLVGAKEQHDSEETDYLYEVDRE